MNRFFSPKAPRVAPLLGCILLSAFCAQAAEKDPRLDPNRPVAKTDALTPIATAAQMQVPPGFHVQLIAGEPDLQQPIAYTIDDRGRIWVVENTNYPVSPGEAKDRVIVLEDVNHNGKFEKRTVFWDKATFTSGIAVGFGGVWLGSPPNLLFIPDKDGDAIPDGPPQAMLDGWGADDTHETLNDFMWGPDGWLYGTQGIFTQSRVGKPGAAPADRVPINGGVWRYHPTKKVFERWCEGVSNQWGLDWNDLGEAFFAACVIPHMWHAIEGAHYTRQAGTHFNPHVYEDIKTIAWGRYEKAAYCGAMIYLGGAFAPEWRDVFFFHDIHMNKMRSEVFVPDGSGFKSARKADFLVSPDAWFRGLSPQYGPDGGVFFNDWYDRVPCHQQAAYTDRTNGRIYRLLNDAVKTVDVDLSKASDAELVAYQLNPNDWFVRHARRLLQERGAKAETTAALEKILLENPEPTRQLRALWVLHSQKALSEATALRALDAQSENVRGWTMTALCEEGTPSAAVLAKLGAMAQSDASPTVRRRIASAAQRIDTAQRWPLLTALASHGEDAADRNIPLMTWYAAEGAVAADPARGITLLEGAKIPKLHEFIARRVVAAALESGKFSVMETLSATLAKSDSAVRGQMLKGMLAALKGQQRVAEPAGWEAVYAALKTDPNAEVRTQARAVALIFGSRPALQELRVVLADDKASVDDRRAGLESLTASRDQESISAFLALAKEPGALRGSALRALSSFEDVRIAAGLLEIYPTLSAEERREALNTLTARPQSTRLLLAAMDTGSVPSRDINAPLARVIQGFKDPAFNTWLEKNFGALKTSSADKLKEIERYKKFLSKGAVAQANAQHGKEIFQRTCAICHTLFGQGGKIGPELPGNFNDLDYLLTNVLDPNAAIGKDYQQTFVTTKNGQLQAGIVTAEDANSITLKTLAQPVTIARSDIASKEVSPMSMMPEGLLNAMEEPDVRDLFLYLSREKDL